jgi:spore coat protein CotH
VGIVSQEEDIVAQHDSQITHPEGWTDETHGDNLDPNYDVVFPKDKVNQIKITIVPNDWEAMQAKMAELFGGQETQQPGGVGGRRPGDFPGMDGEIPDPGDLPQWDGQVPDLGDFPRWGGQLPGTENMTRDFGFAPDAGDVPQRDGILPDVGINIPPDGGIAPNARNQGVPGWADMAPENPIWVPATIEFNGLTWTNVGVRYKGNSSLTSGWRSGSLKLPFKLDFDEFEDEYPEIDNQRFYGFKQLSFSNAFNDSTYMRDAIAADTLAESGLVAAETAYYEVIMDYGEGPVSLGLYAMIEVIDDTVIDRFFGGDSGNIYEGDGRGVSLAQGTFNQIQNSFLKENNREEADWSDIEELYNTLHAESRTSDTEAWRESLESIFDVDSFLEWLAISAIIQHWDTYGSMTHNFYFYHDPNTGLLTWISWDHNMVLGVGGGVGGRGGMGVPGRGMGDTLSLARDEVSEQWPLIRYLLDDPIYYERYTEYIEATINGAFDPDKMAEKCRELADLIAPYAVQESSNTAFESAVQELINRIYERYEAANTFLAAGS